MAKVFRVTVQVLAYLGFVAVVAYLSASPAYDYASADMAAIKLSLSHAADRVEPCVQLTPEQMAELAPNMRRAEVCERERLPLTVRLEIDGELLAQIEAPPSGLWNDGPASVYERFEIAPGRHRITAMLRQSARADGWDFAHSEEVTLAAGRYFTITFRAETGGFRFR
jgi:hypothetical protein